MTTHLDDLLQPGDDPGDQPDAYRELLGNAPTVRPQQRRKGSAVTAALTGATLLALAFGGGVLVQKNHDKSLASSNTGALPAGISGAGFGGAGGAGAAAGGGFPVGGFPGGGAAPTFGTVVSATSTTLIIKDNTGKRITIKIGKATTLSTTKTATITDYKAGESVTVTGTAGKDGSITATRVSQGGGFPGGN